MSSPTNDLPTRLLLRWTRLFASHRIILAIVLIAQAILFSALSAGIHWQPDILQFFSADSADVQSHTTQDFLNHRFAEIKTRLADPDGEFLLRQLTADPLNLSPLIASRLQSLSPAKQSTANFHDGILMTQDANNRWHGML